MTATGPGEAWDLPATRPVRRPAGPDPTADAALVRRVRWRLLAWSGGSTLVILLVLGAALYAVAAGSLASAATDQLWGRAKSMAASTQNVTGGPGVIGRGPANDVVTMVEGEPGLVIGGPASGTVAVIVPSGVVAGVSGPTPTVGPFVDTAALAAVERTGEAVVTEATIADVPWRILTVPMESPTGTMYVQVFGDRSDEIRTLTVVLVVLVLGGLAALAASLGLGWLYAERALVPIRDAMRRQREFAADASHELRTPLAIVRGGIELLRRTADHPPGTLDRAIDDIDVGADRLTALVEDLLVLARTDSGAIELDRTNVDLGEIALDAAGTLAGMAREAGVEVRVDAEPVPLLADGGRLRQLVVILLDNAIRHTSAPGATSATVGIAVQALDGSVVLTVDDGGSGIRAEDLPRVFDRFWRAADAPPGGTGLGLAIARWIVERHGGTIAAMNRPAGGARFEVRLPR